jgi:hypothetical protein
VSALEYWERHRVGVSSSWEVVEMWTRTSWWSTGAHSDPSCFRLAPFRLQAYQPTILYSLINLA